MGPATATCLTPSSSRCWSQIQVGSSAAYVRPKTTPLMMLPMQWRNPGTKSTPSSPAVDFIWSHFKPYGTFHWHFTNQFFERKKKKFFFFFVVKFTWINSRTRSMTRDSIREAPWRPAIPNCFMTFITKRRCSRQDSPSAQINPIIVPSNSFWIK